MKKVLFVVGVLGLMAAGCGGKTATNTTVTPTFTQTTQAQPVTEPSAQSNTNPGDTSNTSIDTSLETIDSNMSSLNTDVSNVDTSVSEHSSIK